MFQELSGSGPWTLQISGLEALASFASYAPTRGKHYWQITLALLTPLSMYCISEFVQVILPQKTKAYISFTHIHNMF